MRTPAVAIFVGVTLGSTPGDGHPQVVTGEQLLELCSPQVSDAAHAICFGYIMGSFDTSTIRGGICEPPTLTHRQLRDTAINAFDDDERHGRVHQVDNQPARQRDRSDCSAHMSLVFPLSGGN